MEFALGPGGGRSKSESIMKRDGAGWLKTLSIAGQSYEISPSGAEAHVDSAELMCGLKPVPSVESSLFATCKAPMGGCVYVRAEARTLRTDRLSFSCTIHGEMKQRRVGLPHHSMVAFFGSCDQRCIKSNLCGVDSPLFGNLFSSGLAGVEVRQSGWSNRFPGRFQLDCDPPCRSAQSVRQEHRKTARRRFRFIEPEYCIAASNTLDRNPLGPIQSAERAARRGVSACRTELE